MSFEVRLNKGRMLYLVASLSGGASIEPSGDADGWSANDLLALAGTCVHAARRRGPQAYHTHWGDIPPEGKAAAAAALDDEIYTAVRWFADATRLIDDGSYDAYLQPKHHGRVTGIDGDQQIIVTKGCRRWPGGQTTGR
jgi:hypothetical protein